MCFVVINGLTKQLSKLKPFRKDFSSHSICILARKKWLQSDFLIKHVQRSIQSLHEKLCLRRSNFAWKWDQYGTDPNQNEHSVCDKNFQFRNIRTLFSSGNDKDLWETVVCGSVYQRLKSLAWNSNVLFIPQPNLRQTGQYGCTCACLISKTNSNIQTVHNSKVDFSPQENTRRDTHSGRICSMSYDLMVLMNWYCHNIAMFSNGKLLRHLTRSYRIK